jgi:hypothetical protein
VGAIGQAGGTAAALAVKEGVPVQQVDYKELQQTLVAHGAYLEV